MMSPKEFTLAVKKVEAALERALFSLEKGDFLPYGKW